MSATPPDECEHGSLAHWVNALQAAIQCSDFRLAQRINQKLRTRGVDLRFPTFGAMPRLIPLRRDGGDDRHV